MGFFDFLFGGDDNSDTEQTISYDIRPAPEFGEAVSAREGLSSRLTEWGQTPGYGAIAPSWNDIWSLARDKVNQYYQGTAMAPGAIDSAKASMAKRGMSGQPAEMRTLARLSANQAKDISDLALQEAINRAQFEETGRQNWIGDMQNMMSQKPLMVKYGGTTTKTSTSDPAEDVWGPTESLGKLGIGGGGGGKKGVNTGDDMGWLDSIFGSLGEILGTSLGVPGVGSVVGSQASKLGRAAVSDAFEDPEKEEAYQKRYGRA